MSAGTHSTIRHLSQRLLQRWVPKWHEAFRDPAGGFHERLGRGFKPLPLPHKRLLTQCRQLAMYSHASLQKGAPDYREDMRRRFDWLADRFHVTATGGWRFSVTEDGAPLDNSCDLYTHGFVIFALSHYYRATRSARAEELALRTLGFIDTAFRVDGFPGLAEALGEDLIALPKMRRHESHMHLLEACLFAYETWREPRYLALADEMTALFFRFFLPEGRAALAEYYTDDLASPHPEQGHVTEPGHYYEWIWLLKKHAMLAGEPARHDAVCLRLLGWANAHGWDGQHGGIYDELNPDGSVLTETKRLWPFTEGLKANALMLDHAEDRQALKDHVARMVAVFRDSYMDERGFWVEWLNRDLSPATDYMPGTTPYHVYFGIMETLEALDRRGRTISIAAGPRAALYRARRALSAKVKKVRSGLRLSTQ